MKSILNAGIRLKKLIAKCRRVEALGRLRAKKQRLMRNLGGGERGNL